MAVAQAPLSARSIRYVKGVGPNRLGRLAKLGIRTVEDACLYAPRRYEDRRCLSLISEAPVGAPATVQGRVLATQLRRLPGGRTLFELTVRDDSATLQAMWFNQPYLARQLRVGDALILYGTIEPGGRAPRLIHPEMERIEEDEEGSPSPHMGRIVPIYPLASGVSQRWLRQVIASALARDADELKELLPERLRRAHGWPTRATAVRELHFPSSWDALQRAREQLVFEELLLFQLALAKRRAEAASRVKPQRYQAEGPLTQGLRQRLPFALTGSQQRVLEELLADLGRPSPMRRLLQGDVGCGKTVVLVWAMAVAVQSAFQVALMAPTELLAEQHARVVTELLGPLGVSVGLLSQGVAPAVARQRLEALAGGRLDVAIGTHALLGRRVAFRRLALVIVDEQHKFGVAQRAQLARKGQAPDVLVLTATPIPRTLALSLYGDLACSTITELPPGRGPVRTQWMRESQRQQLYALIRQQLTEGRQGYVVYPLVDEASRSAPSLERGLSGRQAANDLKAATQMARHLQREVFPEFRVGLLHGQMRPSDKEQTMLAFAGGEIHLLVSTVIVEVGLDVPNATVMVIEHPERFGLSQLHQLRGRIGRSDAPATCVVVSETEDGAVRQRLEVFVQTKDGFELAERDLEQRGPGELLGRRQHGWLRFRIASLARDRAALEEARSEAQAIVARDPQLRDPALAPLRERLARFRRPAGS